MTLPDDEQAFVETARTRVLEHARRRRAAGRTDRITAVVRAESGAIYEGLPFESSQPQSNFCAERHAINNMRYAEPGGARIDTILVAGPVPDADAGVTTPCGACRQAISEFGPDATVLCTNFVRLADGWNVFPELERFTAKELFPHHRDHPSWDES